MTHQNCFQPLLSLKNILFRVPTIQLVDWSTFTVNSPLLLRTIRTEKIYVLCHSSYRDKSSSMQVVFISFKTRYASKKNTQYKPKEWANSGKQTAAFSATILCDNIPADLKNLNVPNFSRSLNFICRQNKTLKPYPKIFFIYLFIYLFIYCFSSARSPWFVQK